MQMIRIPSPERIILHRYIDRGNYSAILTEIIS